VRVKQATIRIAAVLPNHYTMSRTGQRIPDKVTFFFQSLYCVMPWDWISMFDW